MFTQTVNSIHPFVSSQVIYENVMKKWVEPTRNNLISDGSLLAVLRALLYSRTDKQFKLSQNDCSMSSAAIQRANSGPRMLYYMSDGTLSGDNFVSNTFAILRVRGFNEQNLKSLVNQLETIDQNPLNENNGFKRLMAVEEYINKIFTTYKTVIFTDTQRNSVYVLVCCTVYEARYHHLLTSFVPIMLSSLFQEKKLTDDERAMLETLVKKDSQAFINAMRKLGDQMDLDSSIFKNALLNFERTNKEQMLKNAERDLQHLKEEAKVLVDRYKNAMDRVDEAKLRFEGLYVSVNQAGDNSDLVEYIESHKNIKLIDISGTRLKLIVSTYLDVFDAPGYEHLKRSGNIYRNLSVPESFGTEEDKRLLMDALFNDDPVIKIKMCGYYELDLNGTATSRARFDYGQFHEFEDYIPNPHLNIHNCLSRNEMYIAEQLRKSEVIGAIECCLASAMSVDIHETPQTFHPMMTWVMNSDRKIIYNTKTDTDMTPKEALEWLKANKE